jgi:uncharacterized repeat protein (TIGR03803 family)
MTNLGRRSDWISGTCMRAERAVLTFAVVLALGVAATSSARAQTFTVLYNFQGSPDGAFPQAGLVRDATGSLYGTTLVGGDSSCNAPYGCGVVFKVDSSGAETVLHSFTGGSDGGYPQADLVRDAAGNLYGTTEEGGTSDAGTVFRVDTSGTETVLHSFAGGTTDGCYPFGGLTQDKAGNLYGTTNACGSSGYGSVFRVSKGGKETVLHSFAGTDGAYPLRTGLLMDAKGNFHGVASGGGVLSCGNGYGCGVVYKLSKSGKLTLLYRFAGGTTDGCYPTGTPATDKKGDLYGTGSQCGSSNVGIVWKLSKKHIETVLHNFAGGASDGAYPEAGVIMDAKGDLYGDTSGGDESGSGTVYELSTGGALTLLHSFAASDGGDPICGLIRDPKGNLYGTAGAGGSGNGVGGTVWKLTP